MNQHVKPYTTCSEASLVMEPRPSDSGFKPSLETLQQLIKKYAPILCFSDETTMAPGNVDWYLEKSWLVNATASSRTAAKGNLRYMDDGARYHLQLKEGVNRDQYKVVPRSYVRIKDREHGHTDIQYWFFYPNANAGNFKLRWMIDGIKGHETSIHTHPIGEMEGTWEHLTVRIEDQTAEAVEVYLPAAEGGRWIGISEMKRVGQQIVVYVSSTMNAFYQDKQLRVSNTSFFDLHSSQLEFLREHKMGDVRSCDFSLFSELVSVAYLSDYNPPTYSWLQFNHHWSNPKPDYLNALYLKQRLHAGLGKDFEFLLSRDIVNALSEKLLRQTQELYLQKSMGPKYQTCWDSEEI